MDAVQGSGEQRGELHELRTTHQAAQLLPQQCAALDNS